MITDNPILIKAGRKNYSNFKVSINNVEAKKIKRYYTAKQKSDLDYKTSKNQIGVIINLSQELNSKVWNKLNNGGLINEIQQIYHDTCQLNVMSNIEIDAAKKEFDVAMSKEIECIRSRYKEETWDNKTVKPYFFGVIVKNKSFYNCKKIGKKIKYKKMDTSMDYLECAINNWKPIRKEYGKTYCHFYEIIDKSSYDNSKVNRKQIAKIMSEIRKFDSTTKYLFSKTNFDHSIKTAYYLIQREKVIRFIGQLKLNKSTIIYILKKFDTDEYRKYYKTLFKVLFGYPNLSFYEAIKKSKLPIEDLHESEDGKINILGYIFSKKCNF
ncbi:hypothetical protein [Thomasclavelia cocleata]|uniref:Uncharacterized protein n=2 Tax=Thomasclavelia cocleata TaxID=69824 RepID=A0A1I0BJM9_9FIRM|nr:hypothetical protein [Thomasclavelia cocleata]NDO41802.1 hypothetical protein [Thomasclavelia cocleata]SET06855.1 hypothetical protein SAMN04489758_101141 [Thomasclavelia cocleata]